MTVVVKGLATMVDQLLPLVEYAISPVADPANQTEPFHATAFAVGLENGLFAAAVQVLPSVE